MLLNLDRETLARTRSFTLRGAGTVVALALGLSLVRIMARAMAGRSVPPMPEQTGTVEQLAQLLFTKYLLPFELTSFLILAAIIGAITLARTDKSDS
jgi:NADH-quinone oxidoreductase subunit J